MTAKNDLEPSYCGSGQSLRHAAGSHLATFHATLQEKIGQVSTRASCVGKGDVSGGGPLPTLGSLYLIMEHVFMRDEIVFLILDGISVIRLLTRPQPRQSCAMLFPQSTATPRAHVLITTDSQGQKSQDRISD